MQPDCWSATVAVSFRRHSLAFKILQEIEPNAVTRSSWTVLAAVFNTGGLEACGAPAMAAPVFPSTIESAIVICAMPDPHFNPPTTHPARTYTAPLERLVSLEMSDGARPVSGSS